MIAMYDRDALMAGSLRKGFEVAGRKSRPSGKQLANLLRQFARAKGHARQLSPFELDQEEENDFIRGLDAGHHALSQRVQQASDFLSELEDAYPESVSEEAFCSDAEIHTTAVYRERVITGTWSSGREEHGVFVRFEPGMPPAGCSCEESDLNLPCRHSFEFLDHVNTELENRNSETFRRIDKHDFTPGSFRPQTLRPNVTQKLLLQWDHALKIASHYHRDPIDELPAVKPTITSRIAWRFQFQDSRLSILPLLQQRKKRGDGYTKGRVLSGETFGNETNVPMTDAETRLQRQFLTAARSRYYYEPETVSPLEIAFALAGQDNVYWDDEPVVIRVAPLALVVQLTKDQLRITARSEHEQESPFRIFKSDHLMLTLCEATRTISVCKLQRGEHDLLQNLISNPILPIACLADVTPRLKQIQQIISLKLPEQIAGPVVPDTPQSVILLRSRSDGALDFGIRTRDASGALRCPGQMPAFIPHTRNETTIQLERDLCHEQERATAVAEQLRLTAALTAEADSHAASSFHGTLTDQTAIFDLIEALQTKSSDIEVLWDRHSETPIKILGTLSSNNVRVDISRKRDWFGISGECTFENQTVPLKNLLDQLTNARGDALQGDYVRLDDGQWAKISQRLRARLRQLADATHADRKTLKLDATSAPVIRDLQADDIQIKAAQDWQKCMLALDRAERLDPQVPSGIQAELRDYQVEGFKWMRRLAEWGVGGILADDMGLGKTLQTLAVLLDRRDQGPALVVAPTSVGFNWVREAERFTPDLKVHLYRETDREQFLPTVGPSDLIVCSYGLALRDQVALAKVQWGSVVLDEAQAIKNSRSKTSRAIFDIPAKWTVALTGTPVENHLGELWSLFHVVSPGVFGGWDGFRKRFAAPIEKQSDDDARRSLARRLQPFVLRRTKSQVLTELPPRTEMNLYVDLSPEEREHYDRVRLSAIGEIDQLAALPDVKDQRFKILALLTRLRQISCHVGLVHGDWQGSSAKLDQLCETLTNLKEEGHRALIFSQFTSHLALIRKALTERDFELEYLDGSTPAKERQNCVDRFQNGTAEAFLISLKAGGTGLNLTAADYVIHMDPWWNPAVEDQATDRAHRIGQDQPVMVYRIVARNTIEEEILSLHDSKRELVAGIMDGTQTAAKLSNEELIRMLRERS